MEGISPIKSEKYVRAHGEDCDHTLIPRQLDSSRLDWTRIKSNGNTLWPINIASVSYITDHSLLAFILRTSYFHLLSSYFHM